MKRVVENSSHLRGEVLDDLVDVAGSATGPPPDPEGGIPKQWLPGFIRWPIKCLFLPFVCLDVFAQKIAKKFFVPPYKEEGFCKKRGNCCHYVLLQKQRSFLDRLQLFWNSQVNGFYLRSPKTKQIDGMEVYVMGCRYLQKDGSCGQYRLRPKICREWPIIETFGPPQRLKGCGYRALERKF